MKKYILPYIVLLPLIVYNPTIAQSDGCDGKRYLQEMFSEVKITTLTFGRNISLLDDTINLKMDIYEPVGDLITKRPALILAFGGAFVSGDRFQLAELAYYFAKHGYVVSCIDYRIWPVFVKGFPDSSAIIDVAIKAMGDMKAAIRYLKSHANTFRIDTNLVFIGGVSAGAITAIQSAYLDANDVIPSYIQKAIDQNGGLQGSSNKSNLNYSSTIRGVLNLSGAILDLDWIDKGESPMASMHGTADNVVPFNSGKAAGILSMQGSGVIHPVLRSRNIQEVLISVPGGLHTDIYIEQSFQNYVDSFRVIAKKMFNNIICQQIISSQVALYQKTIKIYPTPAKDHITIESDQIIRSVNLYDMTGRMISTKLLGNRLEWDANISPGIYIVEALMDRHQKALTKVMIR